MNAPKFRLLSLLAIAVLVLTACAPRTNAGGQAPASALTEAQATDLAENAFVAFNAGDYAAWSRDWDDAMKAAIQETDFLNWRATVLDTYGQYVAIDTVDLIAGQAPGTVRWVFVTDFERGQIRFGLAFQADGTQIVGVHPEAVE